MTWSSLSLTVKVMILAGMKARAIEKMNPPMIPSVAPSSPLNFSVNLSGLLMTLISMAGFTYLTIAWFIEFRRMGIAI